MKSSHCMLNQTQSNCETSQAKETPEHYLLEKDREVLFKIIKKKIQKKKEKTQPIHHHLNSRRCAWRTKHYA